VRLDKAKTGSNRGLQNVRQLSSSTKVSHGSHLPLNHAYLFLLPFFFVLQFRVPLLPGEEAVMSDFQRIALLVLLPITGIVPILFSLMSFGSKAPDFSFAELSFLPTCGANFVSNNASIVDRVSVRRVFSYYIGSEKKLRLTNTSIAPSYRYGKSPYMPIFSKRCFVKTWAERKGLL
jgi:hypothetical protein